MNAFELHCQQNCDSERGVLMAFSSCAFFLDDSSKLMKISTQGKVKIVEPRKLLHDSRTFSTQNLTFRVFALASIK